MIHKGAVKRFYGRITEPFAQEYGFLSLQQLGVINGETAGSNKIKLSSNI